MSADPREVKRSLLRHGVEGTLVHMLADAIRSGRAERVRRDVSLLEWGRCYLPGYFCRPPSRMHQWVSTRLERLRTRRGEKVNVIGPRGAAKSTLGSLAFVLKTALEGDEPYIWIVSDTKDQAAFHLENVRRELEDNPCLAADYPEAVGRGERWRVNSLRLRNGTVIESYGTGQRIRGRRRREHRPSLIVCDDLQNDSHMESGDQREASSRWFHGTLLKAGTKTTNIINLATALHRDALAMELCRTPGWDSAVFKAIEQWPRRMDLWEEWERVYCNVENPNARDEALEFYQQNSAAMAEGAVLLWPEEEDLYTLMRMRVEEGHTVFEREKQSSPIDPQRCEWPEAYFEDHIWFDQWPEKCRLRTIALDPSKGTDSRSGDFSAYVLLAVDSDGVVYIDADLARRPTPEMVADGLKLVCEFHPEALAVEANQFQELLAGQFQAEFSRCGIRDVEVLAIHNTLPKPTRIRRLGPYLSQRRLKFRRGSPSVQVLVNQLRDFPHGGHDDGPDALEMALRVAEQRHREGHTDDGLGTTLCHVP